SSDVCSSDLPFPLPSVRRAVAPWRCRGVCKGSTFPLPSGCPRGGRTRQRSGLLVFFRKTSSPPAPRRKLGARSKLHLSTFPKGYLCRSEFPVGARTSLLSVCAPTSGHGSSTNCAPAAG